ncbi:MAG: CoA transferase [Pseudomonadota bacterium]
MHQGLAQIVTAATYGHSAVESVRITNDDPVFPLRYRVAACGAAAIAANGLAAAELWKLRGGAQQRIDVDARAAAAAMRSSRYLKVDGVRPPGAEKLTGFYQAGDGRWVYLHCNFANLQAANCAVLGAAPEPDAVRTGVLQWKGTQLEDALFQGGGCGSLVRSEAEWDCMAQKQAIENLPILEIIKIGEAAPQPLPATSRPLSGVRVLDLTRVLAGPTCARTLAEHGADVLRVNRSDLPDSGLSDFDTGLGKLATFIDFRDPAQAETLRALVRDCDVFSQAYRPGSLASHGWSPQALAELRPGIVAVTLSAWGHVGPWSGRRGYDTVVQAANGMAWRGDDRPQFLQVSVQDYCAGYLMSFGTMVALDRRARQGGSWLVRVSLARVGHWIRQQGLVDESQFASMPAELPADELGKLLMESDSPIGRLAHLAPIVKMSETPPHWTRPAVPLGTHAPVWPARALIDGSP